MSENGEIYTAGKNFTLPPAVTAWTNLTSGMVRGNDNEVQGPGMEKEPDLEQEGGVEVVNKPAIKGGEEEGENRGCQKGCQKKEDPPSSLQREEVNNNDLGRRSPWWGGGRKEPAITNNAGASSWRGSFTQCGGIPRMMAGSMVVAAKQEH